MRKFVIGALESEVLVADRVGEGRFISLEEEAVITDEAAQISAELSNDIAESNRVIEMADGLEDLAIVADAVGEATPQSAALIDTATQLAVAGTDIQPEELVPSMEAWLGKEMATESMVAKIKETAKTIWENIQAFLAKIWDKIVAFFRVSVIIPMIEKRAADLKAKLSKLEHVKDGVKTVKIRHNALSIKGKMVTDPHNLGAELTRFLQICGTIFGSFPDNVVKRGNDIAKIIGDFKTDSAKQVADDLVKVLTDVDYRTLKKSSSYEERDEKDFTVYWSDRFLGGGELQLRVFKNDPTQNTGSTLAKLDQLRRTGFHFVPKLSQSTVSGDGLDCPIMSVSDMKALLELTENLLKIVKNFDKNGLKDMKATGEKIKAASKKASLEIAKLKDDDKGTAAKIAEYRAILNFNAAYASWVQNPAVPFYGKVIQVSKALLYLVSEHAAQYTTK